MTAADVAIAVDGLAARYGSTTVFEDVTFGVERGTVAALIGLNGAGKTTLLRTVTGLKRPAAGTVRVAGVDVHRDRAGLESVALVQQAVVVDAQLTGREHLLFSAGAHGVGGRQARAAIADVVLDLDLADFVDLPAERLSGGQARRLQIAAALVRRPSLLLLDEPTSGLDASARRVHWRVLRELCFTRGVTMLVVTHFFDEAQLADQLLVMAGGRLVVAERPEQLLERASLFVVEVTCETTEGVHRAREALARHRLDVTNTTVSVITAQPSAVLVALEAAGLAGTTVTSTRPATLDDALVHLAEGGAEVARVTGRGSA